MKKQHRYRPLEIVKSVRQQQESEGDMLDMLKKNGWVEKEITADEYLSFVYSRNFMDPEYTGKLSGLNRFIERATQKGLEDKIMPSEFRTNRITEWRDYFSMAPAILKWSMHKQSYKLDADFFSELIGTKEIAVPQSFAGCLPFPDLYIDLSAIRELLPIEGAFVHAIKTDKGDQAAVYMVAGDALFSYYTAFRYDETGCFVIPEDTLPTTRFIARSLGDDGTETICTLQNDCRALVCKAIIQILLFLSSSKPDIRESNLTKKTYHPSGVVRDKFSEVRIWDVGVKYGKAIKAAREEAVKSMDTKSVIEKGNNIRKHRSPRPHVRSAHWHRYHVGPGRKEIRVNWIPPVFVCKGREIPVVIHKISEE